MRNYKKKSLPLLDVTMRVKRATNTTLSDASGVSVGTIQTARAKQPIQVFLADCIVRALVNNEFTGSGCVNNWKHRRRHADSN